jgi:hypothetical protein
MEVLMTPSTELAFFGRESNTREVEYEIAS